MQLSKFLLATGLAALVAAPAAAQTVGVGTTKGGFTNQAGQSLSKVVSQLTDIQMRSQPFGGSSVYVPAVNAGKLEFGLVNELESLYAVTGTGIYPDRKHPNLRVVTATIPFRVAIFVQKEFTHQIHQGFEGQAGTQRLVIPAHHPALDGWSIGQRRA